MLYEYWVLLKVVKGTKHNKVKARAKVRARRALNQRLEVQWKRNGLRGFRELGTLNRLSPKIWDQSHIGPKIRESRYR